MLVLHPQASAARRRARLCQPLPLQTMERWSFGRGWWDEGMWWFPQLQLMTCQGAGSLLQEEGLVHERQGFQLVQLDITIIHD